MAKTDAARFAQIFRTLAKVPSQVSTAVARDIGKEIQKNFDAGRDPFRMAWTPLAPSTIKRGRHPPPLTDTGKGRRGVVVAAGQNAGVRITIAVRYMLYHQDGTAKIPQRAFIPVTVIPDAWAEIMLFHWETKARELIERG